jgi:hypothetical protein
LYFLLWAVVCVYYITAVLCDWPIESKLRVNRLVRVRLRRVSEWVSGWVKCESCSFSLFAHLLVPLVLLALWVSGSESGRVRERVTVWAWWSDQYCDKQWVRARVSEWVSDSLSWFIWVVIFQGIVGVKKYNGTQSFPCE